MVGIAFICCTFVAKIKCHPVTGVEMLGAQVPAGTQLLSRELNISSRVPGWEPC